MKQIRNIGWIGLMVVLIALAVYSVIVSNTEDSAGVMVDGISIDVAESDFLRMRPEAQQMRKTVPSDEIATYLYTPNTDTNIYQGKVIGYGRGFRAGRGCAVGVGVLVAGTKLRDAIAEALSSYVYVGDERPFGERKRVRYFIGSGFSGSVSWDSECAHKGEAQCEMTFAITRDACGDALAQRWQTVPRTP